MEMNKQWPEAYLEPFQTSVNYLFKMLHLTCLMGTGHTSDDTNLQKLKI